MKRVSPYYYFNQSANIIFDGISRNQNAHKMYEANDRFEYLWDTEIRHCFVWCILYRNATLMITDISFEPFCLKSQLILFKSMTVPSSVRMGAIKRVYFILTKPGRWIFILFRRKGTLCLHFMEWFLSQNLTNFSNARIFQKRVNTK